MLSGDWKARSFTALNIELISVDETDFINRTNGIRKTIIVQLSCPPKALAILSVYLCIQSTSNLAFRKIALTQMRNFKVQNAKLVISK